jgi:hypothetical protein
MNLPASVPMPLGLAYDAVSARFVLSRAESDVLSVLSETSGNATNLVSSGWSGGAQITAIGIDRARGDLWVAGNAPDGGVLYHLQLISGRLLQKITMPKNAGASQLVALATADNVVYLLDAMGRRIFVLRAKGQSLQVHAKLPADINPTGLAHSGLALYVSHTTGLLRVHAASRVQRLAGVPAAKFESLRSLAWHRGTLVGIGQDSEPAITRVRLNTPGNRIMAADVIASASGGAGALAGDVYYYVAQTEAGALALRKVPVGK